MPETVVAAGTAIAGAVGSGAAAVGGAAASVGAAVGGGGILGAAGTAVAGGLASAALSSLLAPKSPGMQNPNSTLAATPVAGMPDPLAEQQQATQQIVQTQALRGRASTILTQPGGGSQTLGG